MPQNNQIYQLYLDLLHQHGHPRNYWPQWCAGQKDLRTRELIAIGAILTQRTSWHNADLALRNLKAAQLLSLSKITSLKNALPLTSLVRPAGFHRTKPQRLHTLASFIVNDYGDLVNFMNEDPKTAREQLLKLYGIGPETADVILLYALDQPYFVIDEYTKRLVKQHRLSEQFSYDHLQQLFQQNLPSDVAVYQNFHALIIINQKGAQAAKMDII